MESRQARIIHLLRIAMLCIAVAFICFGRFRGEAAIILRKAARICLECIGV